MTVLVGGILATYALTGVVGTPLSFLVIAVALAFFTTGYVAMARHVPHAATFYAYLARGLGRVWGVAGSSVALLAYNCIQFGLYGLIGYTLTGLFGGTWWVWALVVWALIAILGILHVTINAVVLAALLIAEIVMIILFDLSSFTHPAAGHSISLVPMSPSHLMVNGVGGVFALGIASFVGYEVAPVYSEEARSHRSVVLASFGSLVFIGLLYTASAWAMATAVGADKVVGAARTDPNLPFTIMQDHFGKVASYFANLLLLTSIFAAMLAFHNTVARYVFGLSREGALPQALSRVGSSGSTRAGAPIGGSILQSVLALVVVAAFAFARADPFTVVFSWLSTVAAMAVMLLMFAANIAVVGFFRRGGGGQENVWQRTIAPVLGAASIGAILVVTVVNTASLIGAAPGSPLTVILPGLVVLAVGIGIFWGILLRARPAVYQRIGEGEPEPLAELEHDLRRIRM
jgi:amino acid transporter